ncbi:replication initiation protein [Streptococcus parasanguinis]|jgi:plasmid replication initiation protein|uniref:replication initiation protein n=2 Tax=Streptococcus parasanguinis TaxID=1318 RepID=UPI0028BF4CD6|nr:RepB family plasmid replication initiator protein [Streptococcus parasanguinis]MBS6929969.1 RepB family plasmid replication initiator protein [Lachnospiraceae bacterium oral taxon 082]WNN32814.1 RepB family plasmid replication initiator protein [Streptococcus parasanguinis]
MTEEKNEIREVAKYSNDFNAVPLKDFSLVQKKILMTLIWLIKETDGSDITIDYDRFISLAQSKPRSLEEGIRLIRQTFRKILSLSITEIETETSYEEFMLFTARKVDKKNGEITVRVNPDYFSLIKDFANEYTKFPLQIGNSFSKQYTIDIYKFLRQFADTGFWVVTVENFKRYLAIPDSYGATKIREKIINPALEELKKYYPNLRLEEVKAKRKRGERGRPKVTSYRFHFDKEARDAWEDDKYGSKVKETNVPKWSNPDYKNTTSEETKIELEKQKKEMLGRL